jgi:hypothetical protein
MFGELPLAARIAEFFDLHRYNVLFGTREEGLLKEDLHLPEEFFPKNSLPPSSMAAEN